MYRKTRPGVAGFAFAVVAVAAGVSPVAALTSTSPVVTSQVVSADTAPLTQPGDRTINGPEDAPSPACALPESLLERQGPEDSPGINATPSNVPGQTTNGPEDGPGVHQICGPEDAPHLKATQGPEDGPAPMARMSK